MESALGLTALLFVKHFFADGPLQTNYQVANKGVFLHPAGLAHAGVHVAGTALAIGLWLLLIGSAAPPFETLLGVIAAVLVMEFVLHYAIDYTKCWYDARASYSEVMSFPDGKSRLVVKSSAFFMVFLVDQLAHALSLILIVYMLVSAV